MSTEVEELAQIREASRPVAPVTMAPESDEVELPIGLRTPTGVVTRAQVRELNGFDEEAAARAKSLGNALLTLLERAVVRIGDEEATPELLRELFLADRMALLVGISRCTWGANVVFTFNCPHCGFSEEMDYNLDDLPITKGHVEDSEFDVVLKGGRVARCHWPRGDVHEAVLRADLTSQAEYRTVVLNRCVDEVDGVPLFGDAAKSMSVVDRKAIIEAVDVVRYGPRFDLAAANCPSCGKEVSAVLSVGDLFPF